MTSPKLAHEMCLALFLLLPELRAFLLYTGLHGSVFAAGAVVIIDLGVIRRDVSLAGMFDSFAPLQLHALFQGVLYRLVGGYMRRLAEVLELLLVFGRRARTVVELLVGLV